MLKELKIKEGLYYSVRTIYTQSDSNSFLKTNKDMVTLSCQFPAPESSFAFTDMPIAYNIELTFQRNYLEGFSEDFDINQFPASQQHEICCNTQMILHEILNCKLKGTFRNMFLESKALSLLLCFQKCYAANQTDCSSCKFLSKPVEKEKIVKAREIILSRLNNPPTISELSVEIGINQCYLKKGFKELFGATVYDFVQEQRIMKAKMLLTTTDTTVSQVADSIGFSSVSSFSSAFKKITGVYPSKLQANLSAVN